VKPRFMWNGLVEKFAVAATVVCTVGLSVPLR
jgi:hypothetical protein